MRSYMALASVFCLFEFSTPAQSQTATGVGVGTANSASQSKSGAVAIGGGNANATGGAGGKGGRGGQAQSNLTINGGSTPSATSATVRSSVHSSSDDTVRNVPLVSAPGLTAAGIETCLGSFSGGVGVVGFGASFGTTLHDDNCDARLDFRTLWSAGYQREAVARICQNPNIYRTMPAKCDANMPAPPPIAAAPYPGPGPLIPGSLLMFFRSASESVPTSSEATSPSAVDAPAAEDPKGGPIELVDGKTGKVRLCLDYDETHRYCRAWVREHQMAAKRK